MFQAAQRSALKAQRVQMAISQFITLIYRGQHADLGIFYLAFDLRTSGTDLHAILREI